MEFTPANAWQEFKTASRTGPGTLDDSGNDVVFGPRLNEAVRHLANGYLKRLELGQENKATDERAKILDLHWGRIEHDGARLRGLGAAMTNLAETLGANATLLAEGWQGESYDAFKSAMDKVARTMSEYGAAATATGDGLVGAMAQTRTLYQTFADASVNSHLNFGDVSPPEKWHKITDHDRYSGFELAEACPTTHLDTFDCLKNNDEQRNMITDHFVTERRWENCKRDGCEESLDRVSIMYTNLTEQCDAAIERIKGKLDTYFDAVDTVVDGVTQLYDVALGNVYTLANAEVFSSLRVISAPGDQPAEDDAGPGQVGVAESAAPEPPAPEPEPPVEASAEAVPPEPTADSAAVAGQQPSVQVKDGARTISVTSPDAAGQVRVTVDDGTGEPKVYELDFDAASGLPPRRPADGEPDPPNAAEGAAPTQVPARTDGKCVIEDGPLTITAERPLFSPDSIMLLVDDGSGEPTTYTLDFEDQDTGEPMPAPDAPGAPGAADPGTAALTSTQAWLGDQSGSVSGVLVPDQPDGEAGLAKAADDPRPDTIGVAGAGVPMTGVNGGGSDSGRAGSGWSVHGDLFDSGEPVYSMHGVLGDDDQTAK